MSLARSASTRRVEAPPAGAKAVSPRQGREGTDAVADEPEVIEIPIDGTLDLHTFRPQELGELLPDYLAACRERGILQLRIVHGKGTGALRRSVHALLERSRLVADYRLAGVGAGDWGATLVELHPADPADPPDQSDPPPGAP